VQPVLSFTIVAAAGVAALAAPRWRPPARLLAPLGDPGLLIPLALGALLGPVLHVVDASALRILAPVAVITAGWAGATAGARGEWAALARSPLGQLVVAVARWTALAVVTTAIVWLAVRRLAPLGGLWVPLATAAGTLAAATAGDRRDNATTAERGMAAGMSVVAVALIAVFFHPRQNVGGTSVGWHYWLVMTPTLGAVFGLAAVGGARIADKLPLPRGLADLGLLVLAAGVGAATTVSPFVVCGLAAGAAVSAAPDSPLRATLAAHAPVWRSILALCAGLWLGVPSVWLLAPAAGIALLRLAVPVGAFDIVALGVGLNAALLGPGGGAILGTVALALTLSLASRRGPVEVEA
jgi:hypothetical protein